MCYPCTHCNKCGRNVEPGTCANCGHVNEPGAARCRAVRRGVPTSPWGFSARRPYEGDANDMKVTQKKLGDGKRPARRRGDR